MDALETKNAELQKQVDREYAMRKELGKQYLRAVEEPGNENPCPKCGPPSY
jgi:hypothetical protein